MQIAHVAIDPQSGSNRVVLTGAGIASVRVGQILRCAAYRFNVVEVEKLYDDPGQEPSLVVLLAGSHRPLLGMQVHQSSEPLSVQETETAIRHLLMLPRLLLGMDSRAIRNRLDRLTSTEEVLQGDSPVAVAARALLQAARAAAEATISLPEQHRLEEALQHQPELVDWIVR